jgi:hypothetical protein
VTVRLRFVTATDIFSRIIRGAEMGFWASHTEAVTPTGQYLGALTSGGVQARPAWYDNGQWTQELFVDLPATDAQSAVFYAFLTAQIGKPYDEEAIGEMAIGELTGEAPDWANASSWICSALQTAALLTAGIVKAAPATVRLATPRDVLCMCSALTNVGKAQTPSLKG